MRETIKNAKIKFFTNFWCQCYLYQLKNTQTKNL